MKFRQKGKFLSSREYIIEQDGVKVISRSLVWSTIKFYDFHHIGKELIRDTERGWVGLFLAPLLLGYGVWLLIDPLNGAEVFPTAFGAIALSIVILLTFLLFGKKCLYLVSGKHAVAIKFIDNKPSEEELIAFIAHIKKAQKVRLQQLYLKVDDKLSYEEYRRNIQWLWDNTFLSQQEAQKRLGEVKLQF